jgi:HEAT repeat protein
MRDPMTTLLERLSNRSREVRVDAAAEVGHRLARTGTAPIALIQRLSDPDELVRIATAESLTRIGDRAALPALRRALEDRSGLVRSYVAKAVGGLGGRSELARMQRRLARERSARARVGYYVALHELGEGSEAVLGLLNLLQGKDYRVRCAAANNLVLLVDRSNAALITDALRTAARAESTLAGRSSLRSSIRAIRDRLSA